MGYCGHITTPQVAIDGREGYDGEEGGRGEYSTSSYNMATYKVKKAVSPQSVEARVEGMTTQRRICGEDSMTVKKGAGASTVHRPIIWPCTKSKKRSPSSEGRSEGI